MIENLQPAEIVCARYPALPVLYTAGQFGDDAAEILRDLDQEGKRIVCIVDADRLIGSFASAVLERGYPVEQELTTLDVVQTVVLRHPHELNLPSSPRGAKRGANGSEHWRTPANRNSVTRTDGLGVARVGGRLVSGRTALGVVRRGLLRWEPVHSIPVPDRSTVGLARGCGGFSGAPNPGVFIFSRRRRGASMRTSADLMGEVASWRVASFPPASPEAGVSPLDRALWSEVLTGPEIHRIRVGGRVVLGLSVLVAPGSSPRSAQVVLAGELCPASAPVARQHLDDLVERGVVCIHVDVSKLRLCTTAGVEVFEAIDAEVTRRGGGLWLQGATGVVARVFQILDVRQERPARCFGSAEAAVGRRERRHRVEDRRDPAHGHDRRG